MPKRLLHWPQIVLLAVGVWACSSQPTGNTGYIFDMGAEPASDTKVATDTGSSAQTDVPDTLAPTDTDGGQGKVDSGGTVDTATGAADTAGDSGATVTDTTSITDTTADSTVDTTADTGSVVDTGGTTGAADVPWGSQADAKPYDAGQYNYSDVGTSGGNTGSGGAGLCIPKVTQLNLEKIKVGGKVDIIWFVDTSGSMGQEAVYLNKNINAFAKFITAAGVDFRMVLIGKRCTSPNPPKYPICVCGAPPLGGANCGNGPKFLHVNQVVNSIDGLAQVIKTYPQWKNFLRKDATKNFVAVTDDNSRDYCHYGTKKCIHDTNKSCTSSSICTQSYKGATWFPNAVQAMDPAQYPQTPAVPHGFVFHSIVGYPNKATCKTLATVGQVYLDLTAKTGGAKFKICETNWAPIFNTLAKNVVQTAKPPCTHAIPLPPGTTTAKGATVNYVAEDDFFNVPPAQNNSCPVSGVGFTLDNPNNPKKITLCAKSCDLLKGGGNIQFDFGCFL
ncbi:MAG: hypothetical protein KC502_10405 [Myxococcales bacterium]|nr:hypothetical protein [Myxococcales bacterium]